MVKDAIVLGAGFVRTFSSFMCTHTAAVLDAVFCSLDPESRTSRQPIKHVIVLSSRRIDALYTANVNTKRDNYGLAILYRFTDLIFFCIEIKSKSKYRTSAGI